MTLSPTLVTIVHNEIINDPLALGYSGKTNAEVATLMNTIGSASEPNRVPVLSETPIYQTGAFLFNIVVNLDGYDVPLTLDGAGAARALAWLETDSDPFATGARYFFDAAAQVDVANIHARNTIDYMRGVVVRIGSPPADYFLISEAAMNAMLALGMVLQSRARELIGRSITEAEVAQALA